MNNHGAFPNVRFPPLTAAVCLLLTGLLIYAGAFSAPFTLDDDGVIVDNPQIMSGNRAWPAVVDLFRGPFSNRSLAELTFMLNYRVHRLEVTGYHLVNILIHVMAAWLVFQLTRQTLRRCGMESDRTAFLAAMLWLVMPVHTQSVTYIVQRMNALATLCYLLALVCYVRARELRTGGAGRGAASVLLAGAALAGLLGLASKETAATLPLFIFLYEWFFFQNLDPGWLRRRLPWLGLVITAGVLTALVYVDGHPAAWIENSYRNQPFTPAQRLLTEPRVVIYYLSLLAWPDPDRLTVDYDFPLSTALTAPPATVAALAALAALLVLALVAARKNRLLSFAVFWFLGNLVIESSVIGLAPIFEHRTYLPSVFPVMAATALLSRPVRPGRAATALLAAVICLGGIWTWQRNGAWRDEISLWRDCVDKAPANARARHNLGLALDRAGDYPGAIRFLGQSLDLATRRRPGDHANIANICNNLGSALLKTGRYPEAAAYFQMALRQLSSVSGPGPIDTAGIHGNLGKIALYLGQTDQAIADYRQALSLKINETGPGRPDIAEIYNNLGVAYETAGDLSLAGECYRRALTIFRDRYGEDHPATRKARDNLSGLKTEAVKTD